MAFTLLIRASGKKGENEVSIKPHWWNKEDLKSQYDFEKTICQLTYYVDYVLALDAVTLKGIINDQDAKYLKQGVDASEDWQKINKRTHLELEQLVDEFSQYDKVELCIEEWESGY